METEIENFEIPKYIEDEIIEYTEQTAMGKCRCMKWENIRALLKLAVVNGRLTREQVKYIEEKFGREKQNMTLYE